MPQAKALAQVVVFDLYETLITEFLPDYQAPQLSTPAQLGLSETQFGSAWKAAKQQLITGKVAGYGEALVAVCEQLGVTPNGAVIDRLVQQRTREKAACFERIHPDVYQLVQTLHNHSFRLALLSNAGPEEVVGWSGCRLYKFFEASIVSYQAGFCKPQPEIYHLVCQQLSVEPSGVVFVGDGGADELVGAAKVGFAPYWATWFLAQWPAKHLARYVENARGFPRLNRPTDLLLELGISV